MAYSLVFQPTWTCADFPDTFPEGIPQRLIDTTGCGSVAHEQLMRRHEQLGPMGFTWPTHGQLGWLADPCGHSCRLSPLDLKHDYDRLSSLIISNISRQSDRHPISSLSTMMVAIYEFMTHHCNSPQIPNGAILLGINHCWWNSRTSAVINHQWSIIFSRHLTSI